MKLAIKFGDNDFYYTFTGLLGWIAKAYLNEKKIGFTEDKEKITWLVNYLALPAYVCFQNNWKYNGLQKDNSAELEESLAHIEKYLSDIPSSKILLNSEVDSWLKECNNDNNDETYILEIYEYSEPIIYSI